MEKDIDKLRYGFICDNCRKFCGACDKDNYNDYPRKIRIGCLGPYCDMPCELQKAKSDLTLDMLVDKVKDLTKKLNYELTKKNIRS